MPFTYQNDFRPARLGLSATVGGTNITSIPISYGMNEFATVGAAGAGCRLPVAVGSGRYVVASNHSTVANNLFVWPEPGGRFNNFAPDSAQSLAQGVTKIFVDLGPLQWLALIYS